MRAAVTDRGTGATSASEDRGADPAEAGPAPCSLASEVSGLEASVQAKQLYVPGKLLHLRRPPRPVPPAEAGIPATGCAAVDSGEAGASGDDAGACDAAPQLDDAVLVIGDPMDARFKFIAVRSTWLSDHSLVSMLKALEAAERRR